MQRYAFLIEYEGARFHGWQAQEDVRLSTVQETLASAALHLTQEKTFFYGGGRTDTGVHASGQVAHADFKGGYTRDRLRRGMNFYLKDSGAIILDAKPVSSDFHARFSAIFRRYTYTIFHRPSPGILENERSWWIGRPLNLKAMKEGTSYLEGHHHFGSFRARDCQATRLWRTLDFCKIERRPSFFHPFPSQGPSLQDSSQDTSDYTSNFSLRGSHITLSFQSKAFLHGQVRLMVGTLCSIGLGRWSPEKIRHTLENPQRGAVGPAAPARGLCLTQIGYGHVDPFPAE